MVSGLELSDKRYFTLNKSELKILFLHVIQLTRIVNTIMQQTASVDEISSSRSLFIAIKGHKQMM